MLAQRLPQTRRYAPELAIALCIVSRHASVNLRGALDRRTIKLEESPQKTTKAMHTATELEAMMNAELRSNDACEGMSVSGITRVTDIRNYNWEPDTVNAPGIELVPQGKRVLNEILGTLQQKYDLAPTNSRPADLTGSDY